MIKKDQNSLINYIINNKNEHDPQAIRIVTLVKEKVGYVLRQDNIIFSRLMDAGKNIFAKVETKEMKGKWARIHIKRYFMRFRKNLFYKMIGFTNYYKIQSGKILYIF